MNDPARATLLPLGNLSVVSSMHEHFEGVKGNDSRSFPRIPQPSQPRVSSSCWLGGGISGGLNVPWARILRIPSASA